MRSRSRSGSPVSEGLYNINYRNYDQRSPSYHNSHTPNFSSRSNRRSLSPQRGRMINSRVSRGRSRSGSPQEDFHHRNSEPRNRSGSPSPGRNRTFFNYRNQSGSEDRRSRSPPHRDRSGSPSPRSSIGKPYTISSRSESTFTEIKSLASLSTGVVCFKCKLSLPVNEFTAPQIKKARGLRPGQPACKNCNKEVVSTKKCATCHKNKDLSEFSGSQRKNKDLASCKKCIQRAMATMPENDYNEINIKQEQSDPTSVNEFSAFGDVMEFDEDDY